MKKIMKLLVVISIVCLSMTALAACGKKNTEKESVGKVVVDETKSTTASTKASESESVEPETKPAFEETKPEVSVSVPEELDSMRPILLGLCKTMAGGNAYDSSDSEFFWNSIYAAINGNSWLHPDISLSDDGSGYDVENVRTDRLGLSIVQTMVKDKLRGNLGVESGPGGTHVTFDFKNQIVDAASVT